MMPRVLSVGAVGLLFVGLLTVGEARAEAIHGLAKVGCKLAVRDARLSGRRSTALSILEPPQVFISHGRVTGVLHSSRLVRVDRKGRIRAYHHSDDPQ